MVSCCDRMAGIIDPFGYTWWIAARSKAESGHAATANAKLLAPFLG